jgi:hypothetical protein
MAHLLCQIVVNCIFHIVSIFVLKQSRGHWLISDALHLTISMNVKLRGTLDSTFFSKPNGKAFDVALELICLAFNIRKEVCDILDSFLFF